MLSIRDQTRASGRNMQPQGGGLKVYIALCMLIRLEEEQQAIVHVIWMSCSEIGTQV